LQSVSENKNLSDKEKKEKKEELQNQIKELNSQLFQRKIEIQKEKREKAIAETEDQELDQNKTEEEKEESLNIHIMEGLISADSAMKSAESLNVLKTELKGIARTLGSEMKMDAGRGNLSGAKQSELSKLEERISNVDESVNGKIASAREDIEEVKDDEEKNIEEVEKDSDNEIEEEKTGEEKKNDEKKSKFIEKGSKIDIIL
jgi:hypothetical protein